MIFDAHSVSLLKWSVAHLNFLFVQFEKTEAAGTAHNEITSVRTIRQRNEILTKRLLTNIMNRKNSNQTMRNGGGPNKLSPKAQGKKDNANINVCGLPKAPCATPVASCAKRRCAEPLHWSQREVRGGTGGTYFGCSHQRTCFGYPIQGT
jgi:hypothetical protein